METPFHFNPVTEPRFCKQLHTCALLGRFIKWQSQAQYKRLLAREGWVALFSLEELPRAGVTTAVRPGEPDAKEKLQMCLPPLVPPSPTDVYMRGSINQESRKGVLPVPSTVF